MKRSLVIIFILISVIQLMYAHSNEEQRRIIFPDIPGFHTMKCDFHMHTVFSDGYVWPSVRVWEARKDNLDAIAVTEHIEYQPYKKDIPNPDRNRAYQIELKASENDSLIIINGSEITRSIPPGHANAIFLKDANKLIVKDSIEVFREAKKQDAFIFWNHPHWTAQRKDGVATLTDVHHKLIREGLLDGIEVVNDLSYSDEALQIALDNNLAILGNSDVHGLVDWQYKVPEGGHRPITLVFVEEKTESGIKAGLEAKRTVVYFNNLLIGREEMIVPLLEASISVKKAHYLGKTKVLEVTLTNHSSTEFILQNKSNFTFHQHSDVITLKPLSNLKLDVKTIKTVDKINLNFSVLNAIIAPSTHPDLILKIKTNFTSENSH